MTGFDYSCTARRPPYESLPIEVRTAMTVALGGRPDDVVTAGGGFTPGFAATLRRDGRALFVKAASSVEAFAYPAYRREAEVLRAIPAGVPVPRLLGSDTVRDAMTGNAWVVLFIEHVDGRMPGRPWTSAQADAVHGSLLELDDGLAGLPAGVVRGSFTDGLMEDEVTTIFARAARRDVDIPFRRLPVHALLDLQALVEAAPSLLTGTRTTHNDLRPDNVIIEHGSGRAYVCDWNFLSHGPSWADWVGLLPYLRHDGLDADSLLRRSPLAAGADAAAVDAWLAVLAAYMITRGLSPEIASSPALREHGRFTARVMVDWLSERRKWAA